MSNEVMVPAAEGEALRAALIRAVGWDRLSEPQRELALSITRRYGLDPMLRHMSMIEGSPYITRDGLLHVAHRSGDFDGIEVTNPVLDAEPDGRGRRFWRARCKVWRKSFSRPFDYPGRYPDNGRNAAYAEEMCIKVAEVFTLRRAFDVSAPTVEERWVEEDEFPAGPQPGPSSLAERAAQRAALIEAQDEAAEGVTVLGGEKVFYNTPPEPPEDEQPAPIPVAEGQVGAFEAPEVQAEFGPEREPEREPEPPAGEGRFVAPAGGFSDPAPELSTVQTAFAAWAQGRQVQVKRAVRRLYPEAKRILDLEPHQLAAVRGEVEALEAAAALEAGEDALHVAADETPAGRCGAESPYSDARCNQDAGHAGVHRAGLREAWER